MYGGGTTCSFQHIHDLVEGLVAHMGSDKTGPVSLGNGDELTILEPVRHAVIDVQFTDGVPLVATTAVTADGNGLAATDHQRPRPPAAMTDRDHGHD